MIAAALMASAECHGIVMPLWPNRLLHPRRSYPLPEFVRPRLSAVFVCMALSACASNPPPLSVIATVSYRWPNRCDVAGTQPRLSRCMNEPPS